jgi:hypothetical protein
MDVVVSGVGEQPFDEGEDQSGGLQDRTGGVAIHMMAGWSSISRLRPSVSTEAWRLRPSIFFPAL